MTQAQELEPILEPDRPIIDPHHHLWVVQEAARIRMDPAVNPFQFVRSTQPHYLLDELLSDLNAGHNIQATVFVQCHSFYRGTGPEAMKPVGEVEFVNGVAAMSASGDYGPIKVCDGIVGHADLALGERVEEVLVAQIQAGGGRYRGIRHVSTYDDDPEVLRIGGKTPPGLLGSAGFRAGFARLHPLGLTFDAYLYAAQIGELADLARAFPETRIILDHTGTPLGVGGHAGTQAARFPAWRQAIFELAKCDNVVVKLGGLGMPICGFDAFRAFPPKSSEHLAATWRPYMESCIEAFGANRCMFESNFPTESGSCTYPVLWNAFKRIAAGCSEAEKQALFFDTARDVYRLGVG